MTVWRRWLLVVLTSLTLVAPDAAVAQEGESTLAMLQSTAVPALDPVDLAARYGRATEGEPTPAENQVGDVATFWVIDFVGDTYDRVSARLIARTPDVALWVQEGTAVNDARVTEAVQTLGEDIFPAIRARFDPEMDHPVHVLHAFGLGRQYGYFNGLDTVPQSAYELSNQRDLLVVNLEMALNFLGAEAETEPDVLAMVSSLYYATLARDYARLLNFTRQPDEDAWLDAGLAAFGALRAGYPDATGPGAFLAAPGVQLTQWSSFDTDAHTGAAFLFTAYVAERFGDALVQAWAADPGKGLDALDAALRAQGETVTAVEVFADWIVTNAVNDPAFAGGRYAYREIGLTPPRVQVDAIFDAFPVSVSGAAVNPFGTQYLVVTAPPDGDPAHLIFAFAGAGTIPVLPLEPHSGRHVYWSNRGSFIDSTLTRRVDLADVARATLSFWAWYDTGAYRDYGYVSVSRDGGATWTALPATTTTYENPNRLAVGPGFTGRSGAGDLIPYPYLGVAFSDGLTITDAPASSPAGQAGLRMGDTITAVNGLGVAGVQDLTALLNRQAAGDEATVTVQRDGAPVEVPVTLGAHPTRYRPAPSAWVEETVDLTEYAGSEILLRFEYVAVQGFDLSGVAIDDIRIDAVGYFDDAETDGGWEAAGWVRMDNTLPARFLVQLVQGNAVTSLIGPEDPVTGAWPISVEPGKVALMIVAGVTPYTATPETFTYDLTPVE